ncbi:hypothetical protein AKJ50_02050 [candidate division MSBL1 archaeon SCGC-AAA382A13]|uniref:Uncharacterized protein n=1 Tax=candidate division MSBL1 archaeon SCGC-AAA382A13 TaxID=1698279 RepID=A0A133VEC2_9EURY|nr:hypothetical protein AKJ50_02050 [candidate division MSBL1 archaeon SCGC-AAA382A13]
MERLKLFPETSRDVREILEEVEKQKQESLNLYEKICRLSEKLFGNITKDMEMSKELRKQISWTGLRVTPSEWWSGFLSVLLFPIIFTLMPFLILILLESTVMTLWYLPLLGFVLSGLSGASFYFYPVNLADVKKSEAQSRAIETIMLMSFYLHHSSDLRGAIVFAADSSEGRLAEEIRKNLLELDQKHSYESIRQLLTHLAHNWKNIDEGVRRAIFDILRSTSQSEESLRRQDVIKAPNRVLKNTERELEDKLNALVMPTMTFMVFGSLAIVGAIGLSPIFGMIGMNFIDIRFFGLVSCAIVAGFLAFTVFIGRRRPATIPPPKISTDDSRLPPAGKIEVFNQFVPIWIPTMLVFLIISLPGIMYLIGFTSYSIISGFNTFWLLWGITGSFSLYAYLKVKPRAKLREKVKEISKDWTMSLNIIGSRIIDGKPMKEAMSETSEIMSESETGKVLKQATLVMDKFSMDPNYVFFRTGIFKKVYNPLVGSLLEVITRIKRNSEKASGRASMQAAEFLETLNEVEYRFNRKITDSTGNLWLMGIILLPVVCALSVWIMNFMSELSLTIGTSVEKAGLANIPLLTSSLESQEIALLKLIMGLTVVALVLIIARHISVIETGKDSIAFWNKIPLTVLSATSIYTLAYFGFNFLNIVGL